MTITVVNRGKVAHNLSVSPLSVDVEVDFEAGRKATVIFVAPKVPGDIEYFCKFHAGQGMKGTFRVQA